MKRQFLKAIGTAAAFTTFIATGLILIVGSQHGRADSDDGEASKIQIGFAIAPVHLNLHGKNRSLVGLGSYIVNAQGDCNGCHSAGPESEFLFGGIPYFALLAWLGHEFPVPPWALLALVVVVVLVFLVERWRKRARPKQPD